VLSLRGEVRSNGLRLFSFAPQNRTRIRSRFAGIARPALAYRRGGSTVIAEIVSDLGLQSTPVSDDTVRCYLNEASLSVGRKTPASLAPVDTMQM
jgi:hypothetical protein